MPATIGILNVGAGDTKLTFDPTNPAEMIRSARIVRDMLRRGYALLVEVDDGKGGKGYRRVHDFEESTCSYIIADFDSGFAQTQEPPLAQDEPEAEAPAGEEGAAAPKPKPGRKPGKRSISAAEASGVAVARSAGG